MKYRTWFKVYLIKQSHAKWNQTRKESKPPRSWTQRIFCVLTTKSCLSRDFSFQIVFHFSIHCIWRAGIAQWYSAGLRAGWLGVRDPAGTGWLGIFLFTTASRLALGPNQPPIKRVPQALALGIMWPGREAEVENAWSYTSTPQYAFIVWCSVKHRDTFTIYCTVTPLSHKIYFLLAWTIVFYFRYPKTDINS
jgi:hypothetical protein